MEIILVVLKFVESLLKGSAFRIMARIRTTDLLNANVPLKGHGETSGAVMRVAILR